MSAMPWEDRPEQLELRHPHEVRRGQVCHIFRKIEDGKGEWVCVVCWPERFGAGARPSEERNAGPGVELRDANPVSALPLPSPEHTVAGDLAGPLNSAACLNSMFGSNNSPNKLPAPRS